MTSTLVLTTSRGRPGTEVNGSPAQQAVNHCGRQEEGLMAIPLPAARELSAEVLEALRLRALRGYELGFTEAATAV